ncbi:MAG TPA: ATP synthase F1 subunit epsilon [Thermoanaerobaculia bacterium]|jgi:F-type H+-transporting ATPase subunit epsilon|nr:ATP synthase F1 subunit epsilon [Thermoanaerobaculia bacterium]
MANTFHVSVITPERAVLESDAIFAAVPAHDGELGILHNRAPMLYRLGAGLLRLDTPAGKHALFVAGGFAQMVENRLTILTEVAKELDQLDRAAAERALADAQAMKGVTDGEYKARQRALASARAQLRLALR